MTEPEYWPQVPLDDAVEDLRLALLTRGSHFVVFVGAGASAEAGLPLGDDLKRRIQGALPSFLVRFQASGEADTLENFLQFCSATLPGRGTEASGFLANAGIPRPGPSSAQFVPTLLHLLVARMLAGGVAPLVVSLNFDELLEQCIEAELGVPATGAHGLWSSDKKWLLLRNADECNLAAAAFDRVRSGAGLTVVAKPHGTISGERLVGAADDVSRLPPGLHGVLAQELADPTARVIFLGCSLRDRDLAHLLDSLPIVNASVTVFGRKSLTNWMDEGRRGLGSKHPFDSPAMALSRISYLKCASSSVDPCGSKPTDPPTATQERGDIPHLQAKSDLSVGQTLLSVMQRANAVTGSLVERNAPAVSDLAVLDWLRTHLRGTVSGPEAFLAYEILTYAAGENGVFTRSRLERRGHAQFAAGLGLGSVLDGLLDRFVDKGVLAKVTKDGYALRKLHDSDVRSGVLEVVGPLRDGIVTPECQAALFEHLRALAENKATQSNWQLGEPSRLVTYERATPVVLDSTDSLRIVSEYGTWTRRGRFARSFLTSVLRAQERGASIRVVLATPPPWDCQGYLEWVISALSLARRKELQLRILDSDQHDHHMTLGDQVAIDFRRQGTSTSLADSAVRLAYDEREELSKEFERQWKAAVPFDDWQLSHGLHMRWRDVEVRFLRPTAIEQLRVTREPELDQHPNHQQTRAARQRWDTTNAERQALDKPRLEDKKLYRPVAAHLEAGNLEIRVGITSYFSNFALARDTEAWDESLIIGAGLSVVPLCRDAEVLVGRRSGVVAEGFELWHVTGGHAHPPESGEAHLESLKEAVYDELAGEMHISEDDTPKECVTFLGIILNLRTSKPEFVFRADLPRDSDFYVARFEEQVERESAEKQAEEEFTQVSTASTVLGAELSLESLYGAASSFVPAAQGALLAHLLTTEKQEVDFGPLEEQLR